MKIITIIFWISIVNVVLAGTYGLSRFIIDIYEKGFPAVAWGISSLTAVGITLLIYSFFDYYTYVNEKGKRKLKKCFWE